LASTGGSEGGDAIRCGFRERFAAGAGRDSQKATAGFFWGDARPEPGGEKPGRGEVDCCGGGEVGGKALRSSGANGGRGVRGALGAGDRVLVLRRE